MTAIPAISRGRSVSLHLEVRFEDGFVALSSFADEPIRCTIGDGTLTPGVEAILDGLVPGAEETFLADGSELFGPYDPENLHWMDLVEFPSSLDPIPGQVIAFETPGGHETSAVVIERAGERVRVDFNHPFAGRSLTLRVKVLSVA
jgi:FKBP-type peptidyl-prolyl cis-trans isomerase SlpA